MKKRHSNYEKEKYLISAVIFHISSILKYQNSPELYNNSIRKYY